jgi:alkylation response protein AidB-like acyl-CoA dehydrogenase
MYRELDLHLRPEAAGLKEAAHEFAAKVLRPAATALDRLSDPADVVAERSPLWPALQQAYRLGYHKAGIPAALGGLGLDGLEQHILFEELGWGSADLALGLAMSALPFVVVAGTGNPDLIDDFVRPFTQDREARHIGCWALTEPEHGSDAFMIGTAQFHDPRISGQLVARRDRDYYVLRGQKASWVTNGPIATHALVFLSLDPGRGMAGGGAAIVPLTLRGIARGSPLEKTGQRALGQADLSFDDVRVHEKQMLTDATLYEFVLDRTLALACGVMGAVFTGVARAASEAAVEHARQRVQGGKSIAEHQLVQKRLYDMFARVESCRALSRAVMAHNHATLPASTEHAIAAKTFCTETATAVAESALRLFGATGLSPRCPVDKLLRDARAALAEHGSNDVLALVAARRLLDRAAHTREA